MIAAEQGDFFCRQLPALLPILLKKHPVQYLSNGDLLIICHLIKDGFSPLCVVTLFLPPVGKQKPNQHQSYYSLLTLVSSAPFFQPSSLPSPCSALLLDTCWDLWCCGSSWTLEELTSVSISQVAMVLLKAFCESEGHSEMTGGSHQSRDPQNLLPWKDLTWNSTPRALLHSIYL